VQGAVKYTYDTFLEDIRRVAPEWAAAAGVAKARQLPTKGSVRSPNGIVHEIVGDYTICNIQWAAYSKREGMSLRAIGWEPCDGHVTCLECIVDYEGEPLWP
jgi:hypothetical protein